MKSICYKAFLLGAVVFLTACGDKEPEPAPAPVTEEPEVPMSAEPAEPTGVMNAEPVNIEEGQVPSEPAPTTDAATEAVSAEAPAEPAAEAETNAPAQSQ